MGLLKGKMNIQSNRNAAVQACTFIGSFHDTRASARDNTKTCICKFLGNFNSCLVMGTFRRCPGTTKNGYAGTYAVERFKSIDKLSYYFEHRPGILALDLCP